jgi:RNA polymerase sigma-70 factor (ECF subfamily)
LSKTDILRPDPADLDVSLLIEQAKAGNKKAFEKLVNIYQEQVYTLSFYLAKNHNDAQDLAQEVFIKAYKNIRSFRQEADLGTWLHRIAVNSWYNMQRTMNKKQVFSLDDPLQTENGEVERTVVDDDPSHDPLAQVEEKDFLVMVQQALQDLPEEFRTVLVLREIEGYTYKEIASIMECSLGTVKSRLSRARDALKEKLEHLS